MNPLAPWIWGAGVVHLLSPLAIHDVRSSFFDDVRRFPRGSAGFDSAAIMRGIPHTWHEIAEVPELAGTAK